MQRFAQFLTLLCFTFFTSSLFAQTSTSSINTSVLGLDMVNLDNSENWSFFIDEENKLYFIDFEKLSFNLSEIVVKDEDGETIIKEDVLDLPVNTIFELDLSTQPIGTYDVELRSFTGVMHKSLVLK